jgi:diphthine-ammonia ligase
MESIQVGCSWSGGKDSCFALMQAAQQGATPSVLLNIMNENGGISRSHGLPQALLEQQAAAMELPIMNIPSSWKDYEHNFVDALQVLKTRHGIEGMVFGDIDLQAHRDWEEMVCAKAGIKAILPNWKRNRKELILEMLDHGIEAMIVSCDTILGEDFLGLVVDDMLIREFEARGVDVCGENGEYHTLVTNCTIFNQALKLPTFSKIRHENYWFLEWA